jgi:hypothetical protein
MRGRSDLARLADGPQAGSKKRIAATVKSLGKRGDFTDRYLQIESQF